MSTGAIVDMHKHWQRYAEFPDLHVLPEDLELNIKMEGKLWIFFQGRKNIEMIREIKVENVYMEDGEKVLVMRDETNTYNKASGEKIDVACKEEYHDVYAKTGEEARNYNEVERQGIFTFPSGTEKKDYLMWNTEINAPSTARFIKTEDYGGVYTYLFEIDEDRRLYDSTSGIEKNVRYITKTKYWVEPTTGYVIDMEKESKKKINPLHVSLGIRGIFWFDIYRLSLSFEKDCVSDNIYNAVQQKRQIQELSNNKVKVAELEYQMSGKSINESVEEAGQTSLLIFFSQNILSAIHLIVGIVLIIVWLRRYLSWHIL